MSNIYNKPIFKLLLLLTVSFVVTLEIIGSVVYVSRTSSNKYLRGKVRRSMNSLINYAMGQKPPDFSDCSKIEFKVPHTFAMVALAGYQRSGITWSRLLIERATGVYTSSAHRNEKNFVRNKVNRLAGDVDYHNGRTICTKTHRKEDWHINEFEGAVLIIRNPFEAIAIEGFRTKLLPDQNDTDAFWKVTSSDRWRSFVMREGLQWRNTNIQWIERSKSLLVIQLQSLQDDTFDYLKRIVRFLNVPVRPQKLHCAIQKHPASKSVENDFQLLQRYKIDVFDQDMTSLLQEYIQDVNVTLIQNGLKILPPEFGQIAQYSTNDTHLIETLEYNLEKNNYLKRHDGMTDSSEDSNEHGELSEGRLMRNGLLTPQPRCDGCGEK